MTVTCQLQTTRSTRAPISNEVRHKVRHHEVKLCKHQSLAEDGKAESSRDPHYMCSATEYPKKGQTLSIPPDRIGNAVVPFLTGLYTGNFLRCLIKADITENNGCCIYSTESWTFNHSLGIRSLLPVSLGCFTRQGKTNSTRSSDLI
jgi:hypothetical protein